MGKRARVGKVEKDQGEMSVVLLPPQGSCGPGLLSSPKCSQLCVDTPVDLYSTRSDIVFIPVKFLVC